ncbi:MAG: PstS family phosphate ABC transporter substrate-binding protein [Desulfosudaceae bacterium]
MKKMKKFTLTVILLAVSALLVGPAAADQLVIKGSTTVLPIAQEVSEAFMNDTGVALSLSGGGSGNGIKAMIDGTTDIAMASRFIKDKEVDMACQKGIHPVPFRIALDCIVPVVNSTNQVDNLTIDQLKAIYQGKITNWKDVGGKNGQIVVVSRDSSSGTFEVWKDIVMEDERVSPRATTVASNGAAVQTVSKTKGAIAYIGLAYLNDNLQQVKVNGVLGSEDTTQSKEYPISRPLYMFTNSWPEGDSLRFINYVLSAKGQKLVQKVGSIPVFTP